MSAPEAPRSALVVGGLGFIGAALCERLVKAGWRVAVLDCLLECGGGREFHAAPGAEVVRGDARDRRLAESLVEGRDAVFNLAGRGGHLDSVRDPEGDLEHNLRGPLSVLEACRRAAPSAVVVHASTRQVYGRVERLPVGESHPLRPLDPNGVHKAAAEQLCLQYASMHGMRASVLRLTNVYGPRMRVMDARQNFLGHWIGRLLRGEELVVYGDGTLRRDHLYVEDAVDAFLAAAASPAAAGRAMNVGGGRPVSFKELAETFAELAPGTRWRLEPLPEERRGIDVGDSWCDIGLARALTGWTPRTPLREGLRAALDFYHEHAQEYGVVARSLPGAVPSGRVSPV
ncbi:MAG: NAD-dependent epimerase/dehydratase family protein [Elusimicrobiota bacterium]|nr:MAG: NAD-dependent epimerase/dehydratase family protein [Elusimicrobiota bacterium]